MRTSLSYQVPHVARTLQIARGLVRVYVYYIIYCTSIGDKIRFGGFAKLLNSNVLLAARAHIAGPGPIGPSPIHLLSPTIFAHSMHIIIYYRVHAIPRKQLAVCKVTRLFLLR